MKWAPFRKEDFELFFRPPEKNSVIPRGLWQLASLCAIIVAAIYIGLVVTTDNTNLGTTNGLWKSPVVFAWGHGATDPVDSGGMLYADLYGHLARLIPDSLLRYGVAPPDVTFRKMAILNAMFGGLASGLVFLLAYRFTYSIAFAAAICLMHAGAGFVLLDSINSEDIIPAYAFFLGATICFFEFLHRGGVRWFAASALLLALATLLHWTVMVPGLAAVCAVYAILLPHGKRFLWQGTVWLLAFCVLAQILILIALPRHHIPFWYVLYPGKANAGGWLGLFGEKFWYLLVGTGNYFSGANNMANYKMAFENASILRSMVLSWTVLAIALASCIAVAIRRRATSAAQFLSVYALALFTVGEAGAVYSQPQDPQMQIEPMFVVIAGMVLLVRQGAALNGSIGRRCGMLALTGIAVANSTWNVYLMQRGRGQDSEAIAAIAEIGRLFPKTKTVIVSHGFEGWLSWDYVLLWKGDSKGFIENSVHLARPFTITRGIKGSDAASIVCKQIDAALSEGRRVVAAALWTMPAQEMVDSLTTVTDQSDARAYVAILKKRYRSGAEWNTRLGRFVEILPAHSGPG